MAKRRVHRGMTKQEVCDAIAGESDVEVMGMCESWLMIVGLKPLPESDSYSVSFGGSSIDLAAELIDLGECIAMIDGPDPMRFPVCVPSSMVKLKQK